MWAIYYDTNSTDTKKTAIDPEKFVKAWHWLNANNFHYKEAKIPNIDDIPLPYVVQENT